MNAKKYVILCVDDDPDIRKWMQLVLEKHGYQTLVASNAEEAKRLFKGQKPDFIILDLMMEEIDTGTNLVKELKALGNTAPIYLLSSTGDNLSRTIDYHELGLDGVFQKPMDADYLVSVLKQVLK